MRIRHDIICQRCGFIHKRVNCDKQRQVFRIFEFLFRHGPQPRDAVKRIRHIGDPRFQRVGVAFQCRSEQFGQLPRHERIPRCFSREGGLPGGDFIPVFFGGFIGRFAARDAQPFRFYLSREAVHIVARAIGCTVEFTAANKHAAFQTEVANQRVEHHDGPGVIKPVARHHPAVGNDRGFAPVAGEGIRQRGDFILRHATLLAVLRQCKFVGGLSEQLESAFHGDDLSVSQRDLL